MNSARTRFWDFPSVLLTFLLLLTAALRLTVTNWTPRLDATILSVLAGIALGLALGWSRFRSPAIVTFSLLYTAIFIPFWLARVLYDNTPWLERMAFLISRLFQVLQTFLAGEPVEDVIFFQLSFILLFWLLALFSGYALTGFASFAGAVIPAGLALLLIQLFDPQRSQSMLLMAIYTFLTLLLLGRMNYARRLASWKTWRLLLTGEAPADINFTVSVVAFVLVLSAWLIPVQTPGIPLFRRWWEEISEHWQKNADIKNLTAGLENQTGKQVNLFYGNSLALGQKAPTSQTILFRIETNGLSRQRRYYWRVRSYDVYTSAGWQTSPFEQRYLSESSRPIDLPDSTGPTTDFEFHVEAEAIGALVTPPRPVWVDEPVTLSYFSVGKAQEPIFFEARNPILPGETYVVHAVLLEPTEKQLRLAGTEYPAWVTAHYLQLPENLPPAIPELARQITSSAETPYDKAEAITAYLRNHITYTTTVPPAPAGRDLLAWFLFDHQAGFCNYYATAEVVMLRSVGIPARLAVGFAEGSFIPPAWYTVRQSDAHAWPEVYFPGIGWVEFEPTTSQLPLDRPSGEDAPPLEPSNQPTVTPRRNEGEELLQPEELHNSGTADNRSSDASSNSLDVLLTFFLVTVLISSLLAWAYISGTIEKGYNRLRRAFDLPAPVLARNWLKKNSLPVPLWLERQAWLAGLTPLEQDFMSIYRYLRPPSAPVLTPAEAARLLTQQIPEAADEIASLLSEYHATIYGNVPGNPARSQTARRALRRKVWQTRWKTLWQRKSGTRQTGFEHKGRGQNGHK